MYINTTKLMLRHGLPENIKLTQVLIILGAICKYKLLNNNNNNNNNKVLIFIFFN
jgi:hypothetical protein